MFAWVSGFALALRSLLVRAISIGRTRWAAGDVHECVQALFAGVGDEGSHGTKGRTKLRRLRGKHAVIPS